MRIIVIRVGDFKSYPPSISLVNALMELKHEVVMCSTQDSRGMEKSFITSPPQIHYLDYCYADHPSLMDRMVNMHHLRKLLWDYIDSIYDDETIIWCEDDITIKHLGYRLLRYKYILRLDELNESLYYTSKMKAIHMDTSKLGNNALAVVVPEYNRAHITKQWWGLKRLPYILPNKPYPSETLGFDDSVIPEKTYQLLQKLENKKIILYQGGLGPERPIEPFVSAVAKLDGFAFLIMSGNPGDLIGKYENCYFADFMQAPYHLMVTKKAYMGVIAYQPDPNHNSALNTVYCAPNKLYEYSRFGVPIISNDLPGLKYVFDRFRCGICNSIMDENGIINSIREIDKDYKQYSDGARELYNDTDMLSIIKTIMNDAIQRI